MSASLKKLQIETGLQLTQEYDLQQCVDQFESIFKDAENALDMVNNKDWISFASVLPQLLGDMLNDFQCFKDASKNVQLKKALLLLATGNNDTRQCVLDHLKIVFADLKLSLKDLIKRKREDAKNRFQHALDTLQDIQNC